MVIYCALNLRILLGLETQAFDQDQKHKIFLYKEDFNKFQDAMNGTLNHVKEELLPDVDFSEFDREYEDRSDSEE